MFDSFVYVSGRLMTLADEDPLCCSKIYDGVQSSTEQRVTLLSYHRDSREF
jgi:hypothetical protein